jgi:quercetin dioxygenase-like cupin family protein
VEEAFLRLDVWDLTKLAEFSKIQRVKKDICKTKWFNIVLVCLESGQEIPSRPEPYEVCFYVIDGSGTFTIGNEQVDLSRGNIIFAPANAARGIKSKERLTVLGIQEAH